MLHEIAPRHITIDGSLGSTPILIENGGSIFVYGLIVGSDDGANLRLFLFERDGTTQITNFVTTFGNTIADKQGPFLADKGLSVSFATVGPDYRVTIFYSNVGA